MVHFGTFFSPWAHLGPLEDLGEKQPARLGELGGKLLPLFCYKEAWEVEGTGFSTLSEQFPLKLVRRRRKKRKNQGRGASVTLS